MTAPALLVVTDQAGERYRLFADRTACNVTDELRDLHWIEVCQGSADEFAEILWPVERMELVACDDCDGIGRIGDQYALGLLVEYGYWCPVCHGTGKRWAYDTENQELMPDDALALLAPKSEAA